MDSHFLLSSLHNSAHTCLLFFSTGRNGSGPRGEDAREGLTKQRYSKETREFCCGACRFNLSLHRGSVLWLLQAPGDVLLSFVICRLIAPLCFACSCVCRSFSTSSSCFCSIFEASSFSLYLHFSTTARRRLFVFFISFSPSSVPFFHCFCSPSSPSSLQLPGRFALPSRPSSL